MGETGPGVAFETLTLATLGWWLFTTAAAYVCTDKTASPVCSLSLAQGKAKEDAGWSFPRARIRHIIIATVFWPFNDLYVPQGLLPHLL